jgi:hypothetical protein
MPNYRLFRGRQASSPRRSRKPLGLLIALCGALIALLAGCTPAPRYPLPSARVAIDRMYETGRCSNALSGEGKMDYFGDDGRIRVSVLYLVGRPGNVRIDFVSPLGGTLATLTSDGKEFALLDRTNREFSRGPARECQLEAFLHVPIPPEALVQLLSGEAPVLDHAPGASSISWEDGQYLVRVIGKHRATQQIWLTPHPDDWNAPWQAQRLRVTRVRVLQHGTLLFEADLSRHEAVRSAPRQTASTVTQACSAEVPRRVQFRVPSSAQDVLLEQQMLEHNPEVESSAFRQTPPNGVALRATKCRERR